MKSKEDRIDDCDRRNRVTVDITVCNNTYTYEDGEFHAVSCMKTIKSGRCPIVSWDLHDTPPSRQGVSK